MRDFTDAEFMYGRNSRTDAEREARYEQAGHTQAHCQDGPEMAQALYRAILAA